MSIIFRLYIVYWKIRINGPHLACFLTRASHAKDYIILCIDNLLIYLIKLNDELITHNLIYLYVYRC